MRPKSVNYKKNKDKVWVYFDDGNILTRDNTNIVDKEIYYENVITELKNRIRFTKKRLTDMDYITASSFIKMMLIISGSAIIYNVTNISFLYFLLGTLISSIYGYKIYKSIDTKKLLSNINEELKIKLASEEKKLEQLREQEIVKIRSKNQESYKINKHTVTREVNEPYYIAKKNYLKTKKRVLTKRIGR